jgi:hypothetical protein
MSKLMTIDEYLASKFTPDSIPSKRSVLEWIRRGDLLATKIGRKYYIDTNSDPLRSQQPSHKILTRILGE